LDRYFRRRGAETIDGAVTYAMAADDYLLLEDNGSNWRIVERKGLIYVAASSNAGQSITGGTTDLQYEDDIIDPYGCWTGNDTFTCKRKGNYIFTGMYSTTDTLTSQMVIYKDTINTNRAGMQRSGSANLGAGIVHDIELDVGDVINFRVDQNGTRFTGVNTNWFNAQEAA